MKRLTLLCLDRDKEATLEALRDMGVVHVTNVTEPGGVELETIKEELHDGCRALHMVEAVSAAARAETKDATSKHGVRQPAQTLDVARALSARRTEIEDDLAGLRAEHDRTALLGDFDPRLLEELKQRGVGIRLLRAPLAAQFEQRPEVVVHELGRDERYRYLVLAAAHSSELQDVELDTAASDIEAPRMSRREMAALLDEHEARLAEIDGALVELASEREGLAQAVRDLEERYEVIQVREGMGVFEAVCYLRGYVPSEAVGSLHNAAADRGWGLVIEDPRRGEAVPTLVRYPRVVRPVKVLFDVLKIMPGYWETDVSWTFLIFFTIFVGLLIGDAGYGLLMLAMSIFLTIRYRRVDRAKIVMLYLLSMSVILFGVLSGSWLGIESLPSFLLSLKVDWLSETANLMGLCFFIGAVHLSIAHAWNALIEFPRMRFLAQIGWVAVIWSMFFLARGVVLGYPFPNFFPYLLGAGVVLVSVFMTPFGEIRKTLISHMLLPLTFVSFFVDIISYVRLFAVGVATVAVMQSFNGMATSIGFGTVWTAIPAALVIAFGHSLNLALCVLAVLVHGVRLNTLEFSSHKGLTWSGFLFQPFARRS